MHSGDVPADGETFGDVGPHSAADPPHNVGRRYGGIAVKRDSHSVIPHCNVAALPYSNNIATTPVFVWVLRYAPANLHCNMVIPQTCSYY